MMVYFILSLFPTPRVAIIAIHTDYIYITYRESVKHTPSSIHATLVFCEPMSTTQALDTPAPNVAHVDSYR